MGTALLHLQEAFVLWGVNPALQTEQYLLIFKKSDFCALLDHQYTSIRKKCDFVIQEAPTLSR